MDNRYFCAGGIRHANGGVMDNQVLSRAIAKAVKFRGVMTSTEAQRWHDKYTAAGFDFVDVNTDGIYYTCRAVKYA